MLSLDMDYCPVCDQVHNKKDSLFCSPKCRKSEVRNSLSHQLFESPSKSPSFDGTRSGTPVYALSNRSVSSFGSDTRQSGNGEQDPKDAPRVLTYTTRDLSRQRPLPPIKRDSYSRSLSRSVELVKPVTPLTPFTPNGTCMIHTTP